MGRTVAGPLMNHEPYTLGIRGVPTLAGRMRRPAWLQVWAWQAEPADRSLTL